jgi:transaldolase
MKALLELIKCGQSYWLDNLSRDKIQSGELKKRVKDQGLRGITSNPAIFHEAIAKSKIYDDDIKKLAEEGKSTEEIYWTLVIKDIQDACDQLRPVFDDSEGLDGFVSLEVSPHLAHNTEKTMESARDLFSRVDRPNVLIKIPGTKAGLPAIEQMLYEGLNINITLLFSVERYEEVAEAYIKALTRRLEEGKPIDKIASVASFFLSRIDVLTDHLLEHRITGKDDDQDKLAKELLGKTAIANAKMAYRSFQKIFQGSRWEALAEKGARVQRPLWASTSTKNPDYSDVMYVEPLIGKDTVNTMPDKTIDAFADHGVAKPDTILEDIEESKKMLESLSKVDIDLKHVTDRLVDEGVEKFITPFDDLIEALEKKIEKVNA